MCLARGAVRATMMSHFGPGNGNFLLDEVRCNGTEDRLGDCPHSRWRDHDCRPFETAGVECKVGKGECLFVCCFMP